MTLVIDFDGDSVVFGAAATSYVASMPAAINGIIGTTPTCNNRGVSGQTTYQMLWGANGSPTSPGVDGVDGMMAADSPHIVVMQAALLNDAVQLRDGLMTPAQLASAYRTYMAKVLARPSPTGSPTGLFCTCDNFAATNTGQSYALPLAIQQAVHALWLDAVNDYRANPYVECVDIWKTFFRYGVDSAALLSLLDPTYHIHPLSAGYGIYTQALTYSLSVLAGGYNGGAFPASVVSTAPQSASDISSSVATIPTATVAAWKADPWAIAEHAYAAGKFHFNSATKVLTLYQDDGVTVAATYTLTQVGGVTTDRVPSN